MLESLMLLDQVVYERLGWSASAPGACIIKLFMAVIYGFCNKLECLSLKTTLCWKGLPMKNTLAYYRNCKSWL